MKDNSVPESACIECGELLDSAIGMGAPKPGDITVCVHCGHVMAFADGLRLRNLTDAEVIMIAGDPRILSIQDMRKMLESSEPPPTRKDT